MVLSIGAMIIQVIVGGPKLVFSLYWPVVFYSSFLDRALDWWGG